MTRSFFALTLPKFQTKSIDHLLGYSWYGFWIRNELFRVGIVFIICDSVVCSLVWKLVKDKMKKTSCHQCVNQTSSPKKHFRCNNSFSHFTKIFGVVQKRRQKMTKTQKMLKNNTSVRSNKNDYNKTDVEPVR